MSNSCLSLSLTATVIAITSTIEVFAPAAYAQDATALPLTRSQIKLDTSAKTVYKTIEASSVVPVTTGTFPDYRQREFKESFEPISAWSKADYAQIQRLRDHSEDFRLLTIDQLLALQSKIGGVRNHGILGQLEQRKAGEDSNTQMLFLTGDNVETFLSVLPPKSKEIRNICSRARGNRMLSLPVTVLKHAYGDAETEKILKSFYRLEAEKSRPLEVWKFGLPENSWQRKLSEVKKAIKPLGWEAFACDVNPQRIFFDTKAAAETYAKKLNPSATITVVEEGPAELLLDKEANVISLSGKVAKRALSPEQKKRSDALYGQAKLLGQTLQIFGQDKLHLASQRNAGPRFQFENYPKNWIPPHASISYPTGDHVKIQIPARFSVSVKCMEAIAIPHVDQYQYLVAQGTSGINHGLSGADIVNRLRQWDKRYGLTVLKANWNSVFCRLDKQPTDGGTWDREIKEFCPEMEESQEESQTKGPRNLCLWWD